MKTAAKERMRQSEGRGKKVRKLSDPLETRDKIGAIAGVSGRTVEKIAKVVEAAEREPEKYGDLPGDAAEIMGWLGMIWREEHDSLILALADPKQDD